MRLSLVAGFGSLMLLSACGETQVVSGDGPPLDATADVRDQAMGAVDQAMGAVDQTVPPADAALPTADAALPAADAALPPADAVPRPADAGPPPADAMAPPADAAPLFDAARPPGDAVVIAPFDATAEARDQAMPSADAAPLLDAARPPGDAVVIPPLDATAEVHDQSMGAVDQGMPPADAAPLLDAAISPADVAPPPVDAAVIPEPRPIEIANHSFEEPRTGPGTFLTRAAPPSWRVYGDRIDLFGRTVGVLNPATTTLYADAVPHRSNVGVIFLLDNPNNQGVFAGIEAGMEQTLGETLQSQTDYTLTVEVGNIAVDRNAPFQFGGFPGYRIELLAGEDRIGLDDNTLVPGEGRFLTSTVRVEIGPMHPQVGQPLTVRLVNLNAAPGIEVNFDNVRLVASR